MIRNIQYFACAIAAAMAVASAAIGQQRTDPYQEALHYTFDKPRTAVMAIEAEVRAAKPEQLRQIEGKLLHILQSPEATTDAKAWVCRQLRQAGSEKSADALAPLLADKALAPVARLALQSIPGPKVDAALRDAVGKLRGDLLAGVLQTIGVRGDRQAVSLVAPLANAEDPVVAEAALFALGHIGGAEALHAVQTAKVPDCLKRARCHAVLLCAERMAAEGQTAETAAAYQALYTQSKDVVIKTAALRGIVLCDRAKAAPLLVSALKSGQRRLRAAAAKLLCESYGGETLGSVLGKLSTLPEMTQVTILTLVTDKAALPAVRKAAQSNDPIVRRVAMAALARLGDASSVPLLLSISAHQKGGPYDPAGSALQAFRGEGVVAALVAAAEKGEPAERIAAIRILGFRGDSAAVPALLKAAEEPNSELQAASLDALRRIADPRSLPALVGLLIKSKTEPAERFAEGAVIETCRHAGNKDAAAAALCASLPGAATPIRCALLRALAFVPSVKSLEALRAAVRDADASVSDTAVRGLAAWPDATAAADLTAIARSDKTPAHKILALRGLIRLAGPASKLPAEQSVKLLAEAMSSAGRADEKKLALAALGEVKHPAAIDLAAKCLSDPALEVEAATAVVKIAKSLRATNPDASAAAIQKVLDVCKSPAARQLAEGAMIVLGGMVNIAPQGIATNPDGLAQDGQASGNQAAIDGDPATYWDEVDNQKLYRLAVTFKHPEKIAALSIMGYQHHNYAPKDFEVLCDGKVVKKVVNAQYDNNFLVLRLAEVTCKSVELRITGYYGHSPAIRELGIYRPKMPK